MKTIILPFALIALLFTSCAKVKVDVPGFTNTSNSENLSQKTYNYSFDEIKVSTAINAEIIKSESEKVVIEAPANLMDKIKVTQKNGEIHIRIESRGILNTFSANGNVRALIYAKDFSKLSADSSAEISVKDKFLQDKMEVNVSSSGSVNGNLEANDFQIDAESGGEFSGKIWAVTLEADVSSGATVHTEGKVKNADISVSSGSSFEGSRTSVGTAEIEASSGGSVTASVITKVSAHASSGGSIHISKESGGTEVNLRESSGGSVTVTSK